MPYDVTIWGTIWLKVKKKKTWRYISHGKPLTDLQDTELANLFYPGASIVAGMQVEAILHFTL